MSEGVALARRFYEELCNQRRPDIADEILAPDHVYIDNQSPPAERGPAAMAESVSVYQNALDGHWNVHEYLDCGDKVVVRWTGTGTHKEELMGVPATGRDVSVEAITILRIAGGKIAENQTVWEALSLAQQIGAVPAPV